MVERITETFTYTVLRFLPNAFISALYWAWYLVLTELVMMSSLNF